MKKPLLSFILAILFSACYKNVGTSGTTSANPNNIPPDQTVVASLQGRVIDENGIPVQGASVVSGGVSTTTDVNGLFSFTNINMSSRFGYVKAAKTGYFTGSRSIITNGAASNYVNIQLIPRTETSLFQAMVGGNIAVQPGDSANFAPGSIVTESTNMPYTGIVHVYAKYLDPTDPNLYKYMPGDLRGIGSDGNETALQSFGMLLVELQGNLAEKLQLAAGHTATLTWAIPAGLQSAAPATIPLWYFNDSTGRWIQQGSAIRQGNSYVGQVSHFSFWNCDAGVGTVNFKVHLKDQHGNPMAYTLVRMVSQNWGAASGYTDSSGFVQGLIPKGQTLVMQVVSECGNMLAGANVGPALADQDLGTVIVTVNFSDITLTGKVVDCFGNLVDSGLVNVQIDGLNYRANLVKGLFTLPVSRCFATTVPVVVTGLDYTTSATGSDTLMAGSGTVDAGQISACGTTVTTQIVNFTIAGNNYTILAPPDNISYYYYNSIQRNLVSASSAASNGLPALNFRLPPLTGPGNYTIDSVYANTSSGGYEGSNLSCTISTYGPVFSYITGSFTGSVATWQDPNTLQPISGSFRIIRTQ